MRFNRYHVSLFLWVDAKVRGLLRLVEAEIPRSCRPKEQRRGLSLEALEDRTLLAWEPLGPMPQVNSQAAILAAGGNDVPGSISGKVNAIGYVLPRAGNDAALLLGTAGGGIYRTDSLVAGSTTEFSDDPTWKLVSPAAGAIQDANTNARSIASAAGINRIGSIAAALTSAQANVVYAGTGDPVEGAGAGILRSQERGNAGSWRLVGTRFAESAVVSLLVDPNDASGDTVYAAVRPAKGPSNKVTDGGVFKTVDGGLRWTRLTGFTGAALAAPGLPAILPEDINYVRVRVPGTTGRYLFRLVVSVSPGKDWKSEAFNGTNTGIWTSDDNGTTWTHRATGIIYNPDVQRIKLAVSHPGGPTGTAGVIYALVSNYNNKVESVMRSTNGGVSWLDLVKTDTNRESLQSKLGGQTFANLTIATSDNNPNILYLGAVDTVVTTNAMGRTPLKPVDWQQLDEPKPGKIWVTHPDHHAFLVPPQTGGTRLYDGNDGGIWKVRIGFQTVWTDMNNAGLNTIQADGVAAFKYPTASVYVEGGQDNGLARFQDDATGHAWNKTYFPKGDGGPILFRKTGGAYAYRYGSPPQVLSSRPTSLGVTWKPLGQPWFGHTDSNGLPKNEKVPSSPALALTPTDNLLLGSARGVWKRADGDWHSLQGDMPVSSPIAAIAALSENVIYAAKTNGALYKTTNGGRTWALLQGTDNRYWAAT